MPTGIYPTNRNKSSETRRKISKANKGRKLTEEWKRKISEAKKGKNQHPMNKRTKEKLSKSMIGRYRGNKHPNWQGGITSENHRIRNSIENRFWIEGNFARDNYTCQKCKIKGIKLNVHHIQNFAQYPELRFAIDNGITFCKSCHKKFHKIYGRKNNTKEQIEKFL